MRISVWLLSLTLLLAPTLNFADELVIPVGQQGSDKASLQTPVLGLTMEQVEDGFGSPLSKTPPVGEPPISNWEYPYYRVYFENNYVIHTVLKPYSEDEATDDNSSEAATDQEAPSAEE